MKTISKVYLPQIAIVTKEPFNEEEGLLDNRYITIIKEDHKDLVSVIRDYLWTKECYYNERGSALLNQKSDDKDKINTNNFINIMVTGLSRSGKSTLINVLSEKLVTLESPFFESVTNKIREYEIITSKNGLFQTGIRFYNADNSRASLISENTNLKLEEFEKILNLEFLLFE